jgi:predicted nucleotidyltransferase
MVRDRGLGLTGREVARLAGVAPGQAIADLKDLEDAGLARRQIAGRSHVWRWNTSNPLTTPLEKLFLVEGGLLSAVSEAIRPALVTAHVRRAVIFGSVARGEEGPHSDIDLFVEVADEGDRVILLRALERVDGRLRARLGNSLRPLVYTRDELVRPRNPTLLAGIARDGIDVLGARGAP